MKKCKFKKLDGLITEKYGTRKAFAAALKITPTTLGNKMSGDSPWKQQEISNICKIFNISQDTVGNYFFD